MKTIALVALSALCLSACASITRGTNDQWVVNTTPDGAEVTTDNGHHCPATPCSIKISRKARFTATITKPGYKTAKVAVTHRTAGTGVAAMGGNILVGGVIGLGIDAATGASQDLTPNPANVTLEKE